MTAPYPICVPAGFAPAIALGFADHDGDLSLVTGGNPLPVQTVNAEQAATPPAPLAGSINASDLIGPFTPLRSRPVMLVLSGNWQGSVAVERSVDGGLNRHPLTIGGGAWARFTGNACEPVWIETEEGAELYIAITIASGTLEYRIAQ